MVAVFLLLLLLVSDAWGVVRRVDADGDKDHPTIQAAVDAANAGDIIEIYEKNANNGVYDEQVRIGRSGNQNNYITIRPASGQVPQYCRTGYANTGFLFLAPVGYWRIENLFFNCSGRVSAQFQITNNDPNDQPQSHHIKVIGNRFRNISIANGPAGAQASSVVRLSATDNAVNGNTRCDNPGICPDSHYMTGMEVSDNVFDGFRVEAIRIGFWRDGIVRNNLIMNGKCGISGVNDGRRMIAGLKVTMESYNVLVENNTVLPSDWKDCIPLFAPPSVILEDQNTVLAGLYCDTGPQRITFRRNLLDNRAFARPNGYIVTTVGDGNPSTSYQEQPQALFNEARCFENVFIENLIMGWGISAMTGEDRKEASNPVLVSEWRNNTIVDTHSGFFLREDTKPTLVHNLFMVGRGTSDPPADAGGGGVNQRNTQNDGSSAGSETTGINRNIYWAASGATNRVGAFAKGNNPVPAGDYRDLPTWRAACNCDSASQNANWLPRNLASGDYTPAAGSPARVPGFTNDGTTAGALQIALCAAGPNQQKIGSSADLSIVQQVVPTCDGGTGPTDPPPVPLNPKAVPGVAQATVTWGASAGATSYKVLRATAPGGPYTQVGTPTGLTFTNTGLVNGTVYYYAVQAAVGALASANSVEVAAVPAPHVIFAEADTWISSVEPDTTRGADTIMYVRNRVDPNPDRSGVMRFNLAGIVGAVTSAKLTMRVVEVSPNLALGSGIFYSLNDDGWDEATLTWNTYPFQAVANPVGFVNIDKVGDYVIDVTAYIATEVALVNNTKASFVVTEPEGSSGGQEVDLWMHWSTKEGVFAPVLSVVSTGLEPGLRLQGGTFTGGTIK